MYCSTCETNWHPQGSQACHCAGCHRTFSSLRAFDTHRRDAGDRRECVDPAGVLTKEGGSAFTYKTDKLGALAWGSARG
jgi:hypothetical protein